MKINKTTFTTLLAATALFTSCSSDDDTNNNDTNNSISLELSDIDTNGLTVPTSYEFSRNNESSVSFSGQTTRLLQVREIAEALKSSETTLNSLQDQFNKGIGFANASLANGKKIRNKTANSLGLFNNGVSNNSDAIKQEFDAYLSKYVNDVFPNVAIVASAGNAGLADGKRFVNGDGLEYNQAFIKGLAGALASDQALNHYFDRLDEDKFDESNSFRIANDANELVVDKNYTTMEHHWDEAYGYVFGVELVEDELLQKYIGRVESDDDFKGTLNTIKKAFIIGRAAIVAKNYEVRDQAIEVLRFQISKVIAIRSVYYLQQGKSKLDVRVQSFHDLSEGYGFIYSLRFTHNPETGEPYFTQTEVDGFINGLEAGNGFWDITPKKLDELSEAIAAKFNFTVAQAAN
ncbi:DUF4856 domain-containing protein [Wenyingzhuangia sp. IMCC45533]